MNTAKQRRKSSLHPSPNISLQLTHAIYTDCYSVTQQIHSDKVRTSAGIRAARSIGRRTATWDRNSDVVVKHSIDVPVCDRRHIHNNSGTGTSSVRQLGGCCCIGCWCWGCSWGVIFFRGNNVCITTSNVSLHYDRIANQSSVTDPHIASTACW